MRELLRPTVAMLVLLIAASARADDQADALAIVDKAIKASGGEQNLAKHHSSTWKETGTYHGAGQPLPYTGEYAMKYPDQFRMDISGAFVIVLNHDEGWVQAMGATNEMTKEQVAQQKEEHFAGWLSTLTPLKGKTVKLAKAGETEVDGHAAVGIIASGEGHRDVKLYFDKEHGRLVKMDYRVISEEMNGQEVNQEVVFSGYQEKQGLQVPTKMVVTRDGKPFVEAEITEVELDAKLSDDNFGKP